MAKNGTTFTEKNSTVADPLRLLPKQAQKHTRN
jgi:hypothetical protein